MKRHILLLVLAQCFVFSLCAQPPDKIPTSKEGIIHLLDKALGERHIYASKRRAKADSIRSLIRHTEDPAQLADHYFDLSEVYSEFSVDSTIVACNRGFELCIETKDSVMAQKFLINRARAYFNGGAVHEALLALQHIEDVGVRPETELMFNRNFAIICVTMGAFYEYSPVTDENMTTGLKYARRWAELAEPESPDYYFAQGITYLCEGKSQLMAATFHDCLNKASIYDYEFNRAAVTLGEYYRFTGNNDEAIYNYALASLSNVYRTNMEGVALLRLGELLYRLGQSSRAHRYLALALEKAVQGGENFNLMRINDAYMEVSKVVDSRKDQKFYFLGFGVLILVILLIFVIRMTLDKRRQVADLKKTEEQLARANMAKETYISEFMNLSSSYIEILEDYNKTCRRKLTAGQAEDLMTFLKSGKVFEDARKKFYDVFDEALLQLFPDFVSQVNGLLQPDKQIVTEPGVLTTELRVAAMSRLGIEDASVIARFLGITTNTIYTYRNKLRTRAINRATFEEDLHKIGNVSPT
ncbi:MAG: DUF6377 domain-containing protein [Muribaculaceae bacterium]|nr:DUF6377 domain-containing protein [Muribaculaceae bacterium]